MALYCLRLWHCPAYPAFGDDPSIYLVSAKSLAAGEGYRLINFPETPPAQFYPIGYPAVLALVAGSLPLTGGDVARACVLSLVGFACFCLLTAKLLAFYISRETAIAIALIAGVSPAVYEACGGIVSECLFSPVLILTLLMFVKTLAGAKPADWRLRDMALIGLCAGALMLLRTIGFTVIAALGFTLILRCEWRKLLVYAGFALLVTAPWMLWSMLHRGGTYHGYASEFVTDFTWRTPLSNAAAIVTRIVPDTLLPLLQTKAALRLPGIAILAAMLGCAAGVSMGMGWIVLLKRRDPLAVVVTFYMAIVLLWPWEPSRFLYPILPLLAALMLEGGRTLLHSHPNLHQRLLKNQAGEAALLIVFLGSVAVDCMRVRNVISHGHWGGAEAAADWQEKSAAMAWIRDNTPADALLVSSYPYGTYLFTKRECLSQEAPQAMYRAFATYQQAGRAVYILATERRHAMTGVEVGMTPIREYMRLYPGQLHLAWTNAKSDIEVYAVAKTGGKTVRKTVEKTAQKTTSVTNRYPGRRIADGF